MTPDHDLDDPLKDADVQSNAVSPWTMPSLTRFFRRRFSSSTRRTSKTANTDPIHMEGSGHVEIGFNGDTEVNLYSTGDELRVVVQSASNQHEASMSAVLDADNARELGEELVHLASQIDASD